MNIITPGHLYELRDFESKEHEQLIQFIEKEPASPGSTELKLINDGTTNEEVLAVVIDRINFLNKKFPCRENSIALTHIETASSTTKLNLFPLQLVRLPKQAL